MNRQTKFLTLSILTILVVSSIAVAWHFTVQAKKPLPDKKERRNVEIYPRECKLYPNQTQQFHVNVYDGVPPFSFRWYVNGTFYADTATINFQFEEPCNYIILSVMVFDKHGNFGQDQVLVYDPAFTERSRYLEAPLPLSFLVETNGTYTAMYNGSTLQRTWLSTDAGAVVQACYGNLSDGGNLLFRQGTYVFDSVTIGNRPLRIIAEYGTVIRPTANDKTIFLVNKHVVASEVLVVIEGFRFESNDKTGCVAIEIRDSTRVKVRDCFFDGTQSAPFVNGILVHAYDTTHFCESTQLENNVFHMCLVSIEFKKTSGYSSFAQTYLENQFITMFPVTGGNPIGIKVGTDCTMWRTYLTNVVIWSDDGVGGSTDHATALYVDGTIDGGLWQICMETFGTPTNNTLLSIGANGNLDRAVIEYDRVGTVNTLVNNPNSKAVGLFYRDYKERLKGDQWVEWTAQETSQTVTLTLPEEDTAYAVVCTFWWNCGNWWISDKTTTSFTITVETAPDPANVWAWFIFRNENEVQ